MALKGLDIFKLTPRTNCKECGNPTCMAFAMKVAQGTAQIEACPHMSADALASLSEATAPPMKALKFGAGDAELALGGETVLFRHDKTFVARNPFAVTITGADADAKLEAAKKVDYERIGEHMKVDAINVEYTGDKAAFVDAVKKAAALGRAVILEVQDVDAAKEALAAVGDAKPILNGATPDNYKEMSDLAKGAGALLGVTGPSLDAIYDTVKALEEADNKDLVIDVGSASVKEAFANAVQIRRAALKDGDRSMGYPTIVNVSKLGGGCPHKETGLASLFTLKYGSIVILSEMSYAQALPLYGLRQNIYTDPQKPMTVEVGNYPINGAGADSACVLTVDFALTYFIIAGEIERSGVPMNLLIPDAGGYSVLTAWAAGKLSAASIAKFIKDADIEGTIKNRDLVMPGKVAVLKGELEESLPGWNIIIGPNEAISLVKFLKERYAS
ncbi:MAG: acetyl-CoA decarbonylase/synthase complex subunit gamma [Clostridiales Family XIII bacterium]|jgi:acetyl-CoA decarbonylase/synthase complex subunit gamma|nr:acetyl-CoA decarbonylase/synthase complex subunit gamma [Clostridiales Family XIII bacterium]